MIYYYLKVHGKLHSVTTEDKT